MEAVTTELYLGDGVRPSLFQQGRFYKFFKDLMKLVGPAAAPPSSSQELVATSAAHPFVLTIPDSSNKLPFRDVLDQTLTGTFTLLPESEIAALRKNYVDKTGMHPSKAERPSDEQLSALAAFLRNRPDGRVRPPFVEFAILIRVMGVRPS